MADEKDKGFRVIDRRGREEAPPSPAPGETPVSPATEGKAPEAVPGAPTGSGESPAEQPQKEFQEAAAKEGNRSAAPGVQGEKGRGEGRPQLGAPHLIDHRYWGRGHVGPYSFVTANITAAKKYGLAAVPLYMLARDGKVIADDSTKMTFSKSGSQIDEHTGKPVPDADLL